MIMAAPLVKKFLTFLENLKGDDNYKTLHINMWMQYSLNQYTNKLSVQFAADYNVL